MITSKQRAYLRGLANDMPCIFQVGKGGITEEMARQVSNALEARELMKVKCLDNCEYSAREAGQILAEMTGADVVSTVGNRFVLYKASVNKKRIELP